MNAHDTPTGLRDSEQFLCMVVQTLYLTSTSVTQEATGFTTRIAKRRAGMVEIYAELIDRDRSVQIISDAAGNIGISYTIPLEDYTRPKVVARYPLTLLTPETADVAIAGMVCWLKTGQL